MNPTFFPITGEYRRALRTAAAECDAATLYRIALELAAAYEATAPAEPTDAEAITHS